jgi:cysteinyl-tRNA synthetase
LADKPNTDSFPALAAAAEQIFTPVKNVLGVITRTPSDWFKANLAMPLEKVENMIAQRVDARKEKNFEKADSIRKELEAQGIELLDTADGTRFRAKKLRS